MDSLNNNKNVSFTNLLAQCIIDCPGQDVKLQVVCYSMTERIFRAPGVRIKYLSLLIIVNKPYPIYSIITIYICKLVIRVKVVKVVGFVQFFN